MSDELGDADPFAEDEEPDEENLISEGMVKMITYLIHKLADRKGKDFKDIQTKCKKLFGYTNLAKINMENGHNIINKLIELTGGEKEKPPAGATDDASKPKETKKEPVGKEKEKPEDDTVTATMRKAIRAAVDITLKEVVEKDVPVQGLGGFVLEIGKVIFDAKMSEEASG